MTTVSVNEKSVNLGTASFVHCFYSTVDKYVPKPEIPHALDFLKNGKLDFPDCLEAAREFNVIRDKLSTLSPNEVIWDMDNTRESPPWGNNYSPIITSLGNYFITADGDDLIYEIIKLLQYSYEKQFDIIIN